MATAGLRSFGITARRTSDRRQSPCSRRQTGLVFGGSRTTAPGYGGSTPEPGRDLASGAGLVASLADALGIDRIAVMGHSGGGSHALACGARLPGRVLAVISIAGLAPFGAEGLDWFAGEVRRRVSARGCRRARREGAP
jgi:pimeloyl-ACP methyl ester carboxylesterase